MDVDDVWTNPKRTQAQGPLMRIARKEREAHIPGSSEQGIPHHHAASSSRGSLPSLQDAKHDFQQAVERLTEVCVLQCCTDSCPEFISIDTPTAAYDNCVSVLRYDHTCRSRLVMQVMRARGGRDEEDLELGNVLHNLQQMQNPGPMLDPPHEEEAAILEAADWDPPSEGEGDDWDMLQNGEPPEEGQQQHLQPLNGDEAADNAVEQDHADVLEVEGEQAQEEPAGQHEQVHDEELPPHAAALQPQQQQMVNAVQQRPAAPGTVRWLQENADQPVVPGGKDIMTVIFTMLSILSYKNIHKETFDLVMSAVNDLLPPGNHWPR